jgi:hypothetical protein|tara:strand:+ start:426 stop:695 length:270 start_codon:yes stop_codon:yes gene_type:complete
MKKSFEFVFFVILVGMLIGTVFSLFISFFIPEGVVKNFFLLSKSLGFGAVENNWLDLGFIRFKIGFFFDISIVSVIGLLVSWYLLRYFK